MTTEDDKTASAKELLSLLQKQKQSKKDLASQRRDELADMERAKKLRIDDLDIDEKKREVALANIEAERERIELLRKTTPMLEKEYDQQMKLLLLAKRRVEAEKEGAKIAEGAMKRFLGITKDSGNMFKNWDVKMKGMAKQMKSTISLNNIAGAGLSKIVESTIALALAQDKAAVAFNRSTGSAGKYTKKIRALERRMFNYGVTAEEAGKSFEALFKGVSDFTNMGDTAQQQLVDTASILAEMGVSLDTTAANMQFFLKVMKKGPEQAAKATRKLFSAAQQLGISVQQLASDFESAKGLIAALGETGEDAFIKLQAQSKASGLSFDILLSTVEKFDTFSSAAEHVGKLNAILGGPFLNSLEMVAETDPAERMRKLSEGIRASGVSFEEMGYYQKKAMTAAMGLNNEMELALFLSGDLEDARGPVKTTEDFKELAEQTRNFQTFMDELKQFAAGMAEDMGPVLDWIKDLIHNFTKYAGVIKAVIGTLSLMVVAIQAVSAAQAALAIATAFATGGANIWAGIAAITAAGTVLAGAYYMQSQITGAAGVAAEGPKSAKDKGRPTLHKGGYGTGEMTEVQQGELAHVEQDTYLSPRGAFNPYTLSSAYDSRANAGGRGGGGMPDVHVTVKIGDKEFNELVNSVEIKKYVGGGGASKMWASATKIPFSGPA